MSEEIGLLEVLPVSGLTDMEAVLPQTSKAGVSGGIGTARGLYLQRSNQKPHTLRTYGFSVRKSPHCGWCGWTREVCHLYGAIKHMLYAWDIGEGKPVTTSLRTFEQPSGTSPWQRTQVFCQQPTPACSHVSQPSWKVIFSPSDYCSQHCCNLMRNPTPEGLHESTPAFWTNRRHVR